MNATEVKRNELINWVETPRPKTDLAMVAQVCWHNNWLMPVIRGKGVLKKEVIRDGCLLRPLSMEKKPLPREAKVKVKILRQAGVKFIGFYVAHDMPWIEEEDKAKVTVPDVVPVYDAPTQEKKVEAIVKSIEKTKGPDKRKVAEGVAKAFGIAAAAAGAILVVGVIALSIIAFAACTSDPLLVGVMRDGTRIGIHAWLDV